MHRPVLVEAPDMLPVSVAEAKLHLRVDHSDEDTLIESLIRAATEHLDGWTGILGRCLVEQEWRQDFDSFARCLRLPLGPVNAIGSVTWRNTAGQVSTIAQGDYSLRTDAAGRSIVRFADKYGFPGGLFEVGAVSVTYTAGYPTIPAEVGPPEIPARSTVPEDIKGAIKLIVGAWYENREETVIGTIASPLPKSVSVEALVRKYRRVGV